MMVTLEIARVREEWDRKGISNEKPYTVVPEIEDSYQTANMFPVIEY